LTSDERGSHLTAMGFPVLVAVDASGEARDGGPPLQAPR